LSNFNVTLAGVDYGAVGAGSSRRAEDYLARRRRISAFEIGHGIEGNTLTTTGWQARAHLHRG
jgi:hypothetical protein